MIITKRLGPGMLTKGLGWLVDIARRIVSALRTPLWVDTDPTTLGVEVVEPITQVDHGTSVLGMDEQCSTTFAYCDGTETGLETLRILDDGEFATGELYTGYSPTFYPIFDDGNWFSIDDGILGSPVVFEFDNDGSVVETTFLRAADTSSYHPYDLAQAFIAAINNSALSITASYSFFEVVTGKPPFTTTRTHHFVDLVHDIRGAYNTEILTNESSLDVGQGMDGGEDPELAAAEYGWHLDADVICTTVGIDADLTDTEH